MNKQDKIDILKRQLQHQTRNGKHFTIAAHASTCTSIACIITSIVRATSHTSAQDSWVGPAYFGMLFIILGQMGFNFAQDAFSNAKRAHKKINKAQKHR